MIKSSMLVALMAPVFLLVSIANAQSSKCATQLTQLKDATKGVIPALSALSSDIGISITHTSPYYVATDAASLTPHFEDLQIITAAMCCEATAAMTRAGVAALPNAVYYSGMGTSNSPRMAAAIASGASGNTTYNFSSGGQLIIWIASVQAYLMCVDTDIP